MNKNFCLTLTLFVFIFSIKSALADEMDLNQFAHKYFDLMVATQAPGATEKELEQYLSLLTDDVGHSHLPWVTDDSRLPDGKEQMREGMAFYLGAHTFFEAELLNVFVFNDSAIAIRYKKHAKGVHPQSKQNIEFTDVFMELLELDGNRIGVIRKYHE